MNRDQFPSKFLTVYSFLSLQENMEANRCIDELMKQLEEERSSVRR